MFSSELSGFGITAKLLACLQPVWSFDFIVAMTRLLRNPSLFMPTGDKEQ